METKVLDGIAFLSIGIIRPGANPTKGSGDCIGSNAETVNPTV